MTDICKQDIGDKKNFSNCFDFLTNIGHFGS